MLLQEPAPSWLLVPAPELGQRRRQLVLALVLLLASVPLLL